MDAARGWGCRGETFTLRDELAALGSSTWFNVGDRDLAVHLLRTEMLGGGRTLTETTMAIRDAIGVETPVLPASDDDAATVIVLADGTAVGFQDWYVRMHAEAELSAVITSAVAASASVVAALGDAAIVVLGPSNPVTSIGAILGLAGMDKAVADVARCVAVSPVVLGLPSSDPAIAHHHRARQRALSTRGHEDTASSIAALYADLCDVFVLDRADEAERAAIAALGMEVVVVDTLVPDALAAVLASLAES